MENGSVHEVFGLGEMGRLGAYHAIYANLSASCRSNGFRVSPEWSFGFFDPSGFSNPIGTSRPVVWRDSI